MANEITKMDVHGMTFNFKNEALTNAAYDIRDAIERADVAKRESLIAIAKVLGMVKTNETFKEDGYKSVAEFADSNFKMGRTTAYTMALIGERFYNADSDISEAVKDIAPTNLVELAKMKDEDIESGIKNGDITPDTTQKALREYAKAHSAKSDKPKIEKTYDFKAIVIIGGLASIQEEADVIKADFASLLFGASDDAHYILSGVVMEGDKPSTRQHLVIVKDGDPSTFASVEYSPHVTPKEATKKAHKNGKAKTISEARFNALMAKLRAAGIDPDEE